MWNSISQPVELAFLRYVSSRSIHIKKKSEFWPLFSVLDQTVTSIIKLAGLLYVSSLFLQLAIGNCNKLRAILKSDWLICTECCKGYNS